MSLQRFAETLWWVDADGTPVTNTTTETIVFPDVTIFANYLQYGRNIHVWAMGKFSTGTGPPTVIWSLRFGGVGGTLLTKTFAITTIASVSNAMWTLDAYLSMRTNGSSATIYANGWVSMWGAVAPTIGSATGAPGMSALANGGGITPATATINATADALLSLTATWSASSTSHTITGLQYLGVSMN